MKSAKILYEIIEKLEFNEEKNIPEYAEFFDKLSKNIDSFEDLMEKYEDYIEARKESYHLPEISYNEKSLNELTYIASFILRERPAEIDHESFSELAGIYITRAMEDMDKEEIEIYLQYPIDFIGYGLEKDKKIRIFGSVGDGAGAWMKTGTLIIFGNAHYDVGQYLKDGKIIVLGSVKSIGKVENGEIYVKDFSNDIDINGTGGRVYKITDDVTDDVIEKLKGKDIETEYDFFDYVEPISDKFFSDDSSNGEILEEDLEEDEENMDEEDLLKNSMQFIEDEEAQNYIEDFLSFVYDDADDLDLEDIEPRIRYDELSLQKIGRLIPHTVSSKDMSKIAGVYITKAAEKIGKDILIELSQPVDFIGYKWKNNKELTVVGNVGDYAGKDMINGTLTILGTAGKDLGSGMGPNAKIYIKHLKNIHQISPTAKGQISEGSKGIVWDGNLSRFYLECKTCGSSYNLPTFLREVDKKSGEKVTCPDCGSGKLVLKDEFKDYDSEYEDSMNCSTCNRDSNDFIAVCDSCNSEFPLNLLTKQTRTGEFEFKCPICNGDMRFYLKENKNE